jgi:hypothetical protein
MFNAHIYDPNCYCLTCAWIAQEEMKEEMGRSLNTKTIEISKVRDRATLPAFVGLCHRHLEKSMPALKSDKQATVTVPVDLLNMIVPEELLAGVEGLDLVYKKDA